MLASGGGSIERLRQLPTIWRVLPALLAAAALAGAAVRWQSFETVWLAASGSGMPRGLGGRRRLPSAPQAPLAVIDDLQVNAPLGTDGKLSGASLLNTCGSALLLHHIDPGVCNSVHFSNRHTLLDFGCAFHGACSGA